MRNLSLVSVALVAVASAAPAFAHGHNYPRRAAEAAFGAVNSSGLDQWLLDHDDLGLLHR